MLCLVPDEAREALDPTAAFNALYESLYETAPDYVAQLMALTPCADDDPRSTANRPAPLFRAPITHPLSDNEQSEAAACDSERYEDAITGVIRATSAAEAHHAPRPLPAHWRDARASG